MRNYSILHFDVQFSLLAPNQNAEHAFPINIFKKTGYFTVHQCNDSHYTKLSSTIPITQSCPARFPLHKLKLSSTSPEGGKDGSRLC